MRVSEQSKLSARVGYLEAAQTRLDALQMQLSTNRKLNVPSDNPAGAALALQHRDNIDFETQMRRNISSGVAFLDSTEAALAGAGDALQRIRELTVQAANDTVDPQSRRAIAAEVDQLIGHLAQMANTNFGGVYIFGGHQTQAPPFQVTGTPPTAVTFVGDTGTRVRRVSKQDTVVVNVPGSTAFGTTFADVIALRNDLAGSASGTTIAGHLSSIDAALNRVLDTRADVGARSNRLDAATQLSETQDTQLQKLRADIEEVDMSEAITRFTDAQTSYQAALGAIGRTANMSLLDYLR